MTTQLKEYETKFKSKNSLNFKVGDTIRVYSKIIEGEKERIQSFSGIVISIKKKGLSTTFSIYRNAYGCSMEKVFILHSPKITKIEIEKRGQVRKAKLYYLRGVSGKKAKVKEQLAKKLGLTITPEVAEQEEVQKEVIEENTEEKPEVVEKKPSENKEKEKSKNKEKKEKS